MKSTFVRTAVAILLGFCLPLTVNAAGKFRIPVGLSYGQGIYDAADTVFDLYEDDGYVLDDEIIVPLGLTVSPYYEWESGIGVGLTLGPTAFIVVEEEYFGDYYYDDVNLSYIIPIGADVRYTFLRDQNISPYVKVGFRYPIAGGDNVDSSKIGAYGAVGVEFFRDKPIGVGFEIGYDSSEVTLEGPSGVQEEVTFTGLTVSISAIF
jgi:hypothetical protein